MRAKEQGGARLVNGSNVLAHSGCNLVRCWNTRSLRSLFINDVEPYSSSAVPELEFHLCLHVPPTVRQKPPVGVTKSLINEAEAPNANEPPDEFSRVSQYRSCDSPTIDWYCDDCESSLVLHVGAPSRKLANNAGVALKPL